jgi:hypothetical protein
MNSNRMVSFWMFAGIMVLAVGYARADSVFEVTLNTAPLSGTQTLAFSLSQGDGLFENTVTLSDFNFGGGGPVGSPSYSGNGVSGDLGSTVTLADTDFSEFFSQTFNVGSTLSFLLDTTNVFDGGTPDGFAMYLCDAAFDTCYSDDMNTSAMLTLGLNGSPLAPSDFTLNGASQQGLSAPVVTFATPEPRSLALLLIAGLIVAAGLSRRISVGAG